MKKQKLKSGIQNPESGNQLPQTKYVIVKDGKLKVFGGVWIHPSLWSFNGHKLTCKQVLLGDCVLGFDVFVNKSFLCYIHTLDHTQKQVYAIKEAPDYGVTTDYL